MMVRDQIKKSIVTFWKKGERQRIIQVRGTSMRPLIEQGDIVTFRSLVNPAELRTGDVAVFSGNSGIVIHRIIGISRRGGRLWFKERGDNRFYPGIISEDMIIGKVAVIRKGNTTIDLNSAYWLWLNRFLGYYWKLLFALLEPFFALRRKGAIGHHQGIAAVARSIAYRLSRLPARLLRFKLL